MKILAFQPHVYNKYRLLDQKILDQENFVGRLSVISLGLEFSARFIDVFHKLATTSIVASTSLVF